MKAYVYKQNSGCFLEDVSIPEIKEDEILIKVKTSGICGTDHHIKKGEFKTKDNLILGHEFAGVVEAMGEQVDGYKKGDHVVGDPMTPCFHCEYCKSGQVNYCVELPGIGVNEDGSFAEYIAVPQSNVHRIDENVPFEVGAFAEPLSCCLRGYDQLDPTQGENMVIIGDGPVGLMMVQLAKLAGISDLVLVGGVESRKELAYNLGVDQFFDGTKDGVAEKITNYFGNGQIKNIIEAVGKKETLNLSLKIKTYGSQILWFGVPAPETKIEVSPHEIFEKEITLVGSLMNPYTISRAINLLENGRIDVDPLITHRFKLDEIEKAFEVYDNDKERIKIMIEVE